MTNKNSLVDSEIIRTSDGSLTLLSKEYGEEYHSIRGARFEADSLYMENSGFRSKMMSFTNTPKPCIEVLDVGLGLGYNALMTIECWIQGLGQSNLELLSLELNLELVIQLSRTECIWKEGWNLDWQNWSIGLKPTGENQAQWHMSLSHPTSGKHLDWQIFIGNALEADLIGRKFNYIWQDAFSPKKNPELWSIEWFKKLKGSSSEDVELLSYSVARMVRDNLEASGWSALRLKTPKTESISDPRALKKQWLLARLHQTP